MDGAALLLLVSGVGVGFGWQPMPDGSQRYEYVVQVEPELAATLAAGQSIPIVADIPAEVQPIGRIRMVVGREELPRQRLVTQLKPALDGTAASADGVKLAQYNQAPAPRYGAAPTAADPYTPGQTSPTSQEPDNSWNSQSDPPITPTEAAPPSGQALFGQPQAGAGTTWNNGTAVPAVADATADAIKRAGDEMQRAVAPVVDPLKQGMEQVDSQVRGAVGNLGDRTKSLVNELQQPFNPQPRLPADSRPSASVAADAEAARSWNQPPAAVASENTLRSGSADAGIGWNQGATAPGQAVQAPSTPPFASTQVGAAQPGGGESAGTEWNNTPGATAATDPRNGNAGRTQGAATGDPWAGVPDPRAQTGVPQPGAPASVPDLAHRPMPFGGIGGDPQNTGPRFPGLGNTPTPGGVGSATAPGNTPATPASTPAAIASDMLRQPADRPLEDAPLYQPAATAPGLATLPVSIAPQRPVAAVTPAGQTGTAPAAPTTAAQPVGRDNTLAVLVAWVLLTGSIAGNMYLFWSYLDVRQKYRSLVRKTARAVGSRFSAA
ncbi:MAG: hypothetical protein H0T51_00735 [Pirellulales bacterium]|nr:hypothetical protein [Pirellulales bacterium]